MGMDLYNSSPAARAVWDSADAHLLVVYGFSIVEIVEDNPKEKTIHFSGIKGQVIRQRYMDVTYDTMDKDGHVKTLPLFADIDVRCPKYTVAQKTAPMFACFSMIGLVWNADIIQGSKIFVHKTTLYKLPKTIYIMWFGYVIIE